MSDETLDTEEKIKSVARKVFMAKGFDGTTSRDIAEAAGINIALTNYYFRSKENLFRLIFEDAHQQFFQETDAVLQASTELQKKIPQFIDAMFGLFAATPNLPIFLLSEMARHPELLPAHKRLEHPAVRVFFEQIRAAVAAGEMRAVPPPHVFQLIIANVQSLFLSWPITEEWSEFEHLKYAEFIETHRVITTEMLMRYLFDF